MPSTELVRGDVVQLETGTRVPADIRVLTAESLKLDKSSFTGESDPEVSKRHEHVRGVGLAPVRMYKALRMCTLQRSALDHQNTKNILKFGWHVGGAVRRDVYCPCHAILV